MVRVDNHVQLYGWMINALGLRGKELLCYAIVYGFCQDGTGKAISPSYFIDWLDVRKRELLYIVSRLKDRGLINVDVHPGKPSVYSINVITMQTAIRRATEAEERENAGRQTGPQQTANANSLNERVKDTIATARRHMTEKMSTPEELKRRQEIRDVIMNSDWTVH